MIRKDASGTDDVCATDFNQNNNHANDLGNPTGGGGGGVTKLGSKMLKLSQVEAMFVD